jgi:hypothetical protein
MIKVTITINKNNNQGQNTDDHITPQLQSRLQVLSDPGDVGGDVDVNSGQTFSALLGAEGHDPLQVHRGVDRVPDDQGTPGIAGARIFP